MCVYVCAFLFFQSPEVSRGFPKAPGGLPCLRGFGGVCPEFGFKDCGGWPGGLREVWELGRGWFLRSV